MADDFARRFVCACLEIRWNASAGESARQLAKDDHLDWRVVRQLVYAEELAPVLYHLTRARGILPPDLERELSAAYYATAAQNTMRLGNLEQVLGLMASADVSVALLKGAALSEMLYENAGVRPMEDIDLIVHPESLPSAVKVLSAYVGSSLSSESKVQAFADQQREISFHKIGKTNTVFDLHWQAFDSPFYPHQLFTQWLWETAVGARLGSATVMALSQEAMVIHLCGHYSIDAGRKKLLWLYDIASTLSNYRRTIDWDLMIARAQMYGLLTSVRQVFSDMDKEWNGLIPPSVQDRLDHSIPSPAEKAFVDWTASQDRAAVRLFGVNLESLTGWRERLRFLGSSIFPPISYMRHRYAASNPLLVPFTYPYRWLLSLSRLVLR